jgi:hypothetical protein
VYSLFHRVSAAENLCIEKNIIKKFLEKIFEKKKPLELWA